MVTPIQPTIRTPVFHPLVQDFNDSTESLLLTSIEPSTFMDFDIRVPNSYNETESKFINLGTGSISMSPKAQTSDIYLPVLTNSIGSPEAFWEMLSSSVNPNSEGNSYFATEEAGVSLPDTLNNIQKTVDQDITFVFDVNIAGSHKTAFASNNSTSIGTSGFWMDINPNSPYNITIQARTSLNTVVYSIISPLLSNPYDGVRKTIMVSLRKTAERIDFRFFVNGVQTNESWVIPSFTSEEDCSGVFRFFRDNDTQKNSPPLDSEVYSMAIIEDYIDETRATAINSLLNRRAGV